MKQDTKLNNNTKDNNKSRSLTAKNWFVRHQKRIFIFLKYIVPLGVALAIFMQLTKNSQWSDLVETFKNGIDYKWFFIVVALMPLNWFLEVMKWKYMTNTFEPISWKKAIISILAGISFSSITPNRLGEFGGRIMFLSPDNRVKGVSATLAGGISQLYITILAGLLGLMFFNTQGTKIDWYWYLILIFFLILFLWLYYKLPKLATIKSKYQWMQKMIGFLEVLKDYTQNILTWLLFLSFGRYLIYLFQFCFALWALGVKVSLVVLMFGNMLILFLQTVIPSFSVSEMGIRGVITAKVFEGYTDNIIGSVSAGILLWLINITLPALIGAVFIAIKRVK